MKPSPLFLPVAAFAALAVLVGCQKKATTPAPQVPPATPASKIVSAEPTGFAAVAKHLDPGGSAYCYFSTGQLLEWVSGYWDAMEPVLIQGATSKMEAEGKARTETVWHFATHFIGQCGIRDISGFGYSSIALAPGYYQKKVMLYHDPAKGGGLFWKIRGNEPNALAFLGYLPANTALASSGNLRLLPVWEELNRQAVGNPGVKEILDDAARGFQTKTGLDLAALLGSLGPNYSMLLTLDEAHPVMVPAGQQPVKAPEPALAVWAQVQNDQLIKKLEETFSKTPAASKSETGGWTLYRLNFPMLAMFQTSMPWLRPAVAWKQGTVAFFSNDALLGEMLAVKAGTKPGLTANPTFIALRRGMPESGSKVGYVAPVFQKTVQAIQLASASAKTPQTPASAQLMEKISALNRPYALYSVSNETPEGVVSIIHQKTEPK